MKEIFQQIYDGIFRFKPLKKYINFKSNHREVFPVVGFLDDEKRISLEKRLNIKIKHVEFFEQALIHRSYLQVLGNPYISSNERMEFLGDSILGMIIAEYLFAMHTNVPEGDLTKMRARLVNKKSLAICAKKFKIDDFLMLSYSAEKSLKSGSDSILADAMEALIAAIYMDMGMEEAGEFILKQMMPALMETSVMKDTNYKSKLLEYVQSKGKNAPTYQVVEEAGPDHDKQFVVAVYVDQKEIGRGDGKSKKQAEQNAAREAMNKSIFS